MSKLNKLIGLCKCSVSIEANEHKNDNQTTKEYLEDKAYPIEDIETEVLEKIYETNTLIELCFYPNTPMGFYTVYHYDLEAAIDEALDIINK